VTIGPNSIVGAGSVVTNDIPPYTIAAGNPARVLSSLEKYIEKIKTISENKKIFTEEYFIDKLDESKRKEIIQSIGNSIGFIV
jgi:maltose O-acetyltransferase